MSENSQMLKISHDMSGETPD